MSQRRSFPANGVHFPEVAWQSRGNPHEGCRAKRSPSKSHHPGAHGGAKEQRLYTARLLMGDHLEPIIPTATEDVRTGPIYIWKNTRRLDQQGASHHGSDWTSVTVRRGPAGSGRRSGRAGASPAVGRRVCVGRGRRAVPGEPWSWRRGSAGKRAAAAGPARV